MFKDGYLIPLLKPFKSKRGGMHLGGDLKFLNEYCRGHIGVTTTINDEFTYLASNGALGVEDLLSLPRFKANLFGVKGLNYQLSSIRGDQGGIILFILFLTLVLLYSLDSLNLSNRECSSIGQSAWKCL